MMWQKRLQRQKKLKTRYLFISNQDNILGESSNICDTVRKLWTYYKCDSQSIFIATNPKIKTHELREKCISLTDINNNKTYKYLNKVITRDEFILHLECDNRGQDQSNKRN